MPMSASPLTWIFGVVVIGFLLLDLLVLNRRAHVVGFRESLGWTAFWVGLSLAFAGAVYYYRGSTDAVTYLTAYVVEQSLSIDNLFVFLLIFSSFRIPAELQHRVLFWGIIGALIMRAICIGAGVAVLARFGNVVYVFAAILIIGGIKTFIDKDDEGDMKEGFLVRTVKRFIPVTDVFDGQKFFSIQNGKRVATPLFLALIIVELSDVIFAVDSIPAVLAISQDPFIVYTSNIFAILGLRSIYFALAHLMRLFRYLKYALGFILIFVGAKIGLSHHVKIPTEVALSVILGLLLTAVLASLVFKPKVEASV